MTPIVGRTCDVIGIRGQFRGVVEQVGYPGARMAVLKILRGKARRMVPLYLPAVWAGPGETVNVDFTKSEFALVESPKEKEAGNGNLRLAAEQGATSGPRRRQ